jgi:hypothetical protein
MSAKVIKVAVLVTDAIRPRDLSIILDAAFEADPEILQFVVDGWPEDADMSETALWGMLVDDLTDGLTEWPPE